MKMQAHIMAVLSLAGLAGVAYGQGYMAESQAAINMNNTIQGQMPGGPGPVPGQLPGVGNPGVGFPGTPMGGNTDPAMAGLGPMPGAMPGGMPGGMPGAGFPGDMNGMPGQQAVAAPPAIATDTVLTGRRVYDAVSGGLLEDALEITVRKEDADAYPDDGINDNGIAGDGVRGNVNTSRNQYIGYYSNLIKNYLVHAVHNAEQIDPMVYFGAHIAKMDPTPTEGLKRYGRPLPGDSDLEQVVQVGTVPEMPSIINLERDRDELVKRWNKTFLARYRVDPNDPQSEYFPVFVPSPPLTPPDYPVPAGYVAPQAVAKAEEKQLDSAEAAALVQSQQSAAGARAGNLGAGQSVGPQGAGYPGGGIAPGAGASQGGML